MATELRRCGMGRINGVPVSTSSVVTIDTVEKRLRVKYKKQRRVLQAMDEVSHQ